MFWLDLLLRGGEFIESVLQFLGVLILQILRCNLRVKTRRVGHVILGNERKVAGRFRALAQERIDASVTAGAIQHAKKAALVGLILDGGDGAAKPVWNGTTGKQ